jgi:group I intron endonuclease
MYIGQTIRKNAKLRWYEHCACARAGKKNYLYDSIRQHGVDNFTWEVIDSAGNLDELNLKEQHWLDEYRKITKVYNIREAGNNKIHSEQSKEKMKESQRQAHARRKANGTDTWVRRDGGAMKGKAHPRKGTTGMWSMSESAREKCRQAKLSNNPGRGKTWKIIDGKRVWLPKEN